MTYMCTYNHMYTYNDTAYKYQDREYNKQKN